MRSLPLAVLGLFLILGSCASFSFAAAVVASLSQIETPASSRQLLTSCQGRWRADVIYLNVYNTASATGLEADEIIRKFILFAHANKFQVFAFNSDINAKPQIWQIAAFNERVLDEQEKFDGIVYDSISHKPVDDAGLQVYREFQTAALAESLHTAVQVSHDWNDMVLFEGEYLPVYEHIIAIIERTDIWVHTNELDVINLRLEPFVALQRKYPSQVLSVVLDVSQHSPKESSFYSNSASLESSLLAISPSLSGKYVLTGAVPRELVSPRAATISVNIPCPLACSGRGTCDSNGDCQCNSAYSGAACEQEIFSAQSYGLDISPVAVEFVMLVIAIVLSLLLGTFTCLGFVFVVLRQDTGKNGNNQAAEFSQISSTLDELLLKNRKEEYQ
jgi:hypothetical protein